MKWVFFLFPLVFLSGCTTVQEHSPQPALQLPNNTCTPHNTSSCSTYCPHTCASYCAQTTQSGGFPTQTACDEGVCLCICQCVSGGITAIN